MQNTIIKVDKYTLEGMSSRLDDTEALGSVVSIDDVQFFPWFFHVVLYSTDNSLT